MERAPRLDAQTLLAQAGWMRALAASLLDDAAAADDVVQEATVAALRHPPAPEVRLEPWLSRVVRNFAWRRLRGEARRADREARANPPPHEPSPAETLERLDLQQTLVGALRSIDEPLRTTLVLRYFEGRTSAEIALALRVPAGTVRWRVKRGLDELRARLDARCGSRESWIAALTPFALREGALPVGAAATTSAKVLKGVLAVSATHVAAAAAAAVAVAVGFVWWSFVDSPEPIRPLQAAAEPVVAAASNGSGAQATAEPARSPTDGPREPGSAVQEAAGELASAPAQTPSAEQRFARVDARFVDAHGVPWSGVRFAARRVRYDDGAERGDDAETTSAADGRAELRVALPSFRGVEGEPLREWKFELVASRAGCATTARAATLRVGELAHLGDVVLLPGVRVLGRVVDAQGAGLASAEVGLAALELSGDEGRMRRHGSDTFDRSTSTRTTGDGNFVLAGVAAGTLRLWAKGENMRYAWTEPLAVAGDRDVLDVLLVLTPFLATDKIAGRVVDPNGEPVPGANLIHMAHRGAHGLLRTSLRCDDSGRFDLLVEHDDSTYDFTASTPDARCIPGSVTGVRPGTLDLVIALRETRELSVRLRDADGRPIERASFEIDARYMSHEADDATATAPGEYRFALPEPKFHLVASAPGFRSLRTGPYDVDALPAQLELALQRAPMVRGRVLAGGAPLAGAQLQLVGDDPSASGTIHGFRFRHLARDWAPWVATDAEGRYELGCDLDGAFWIVAKAEGWANAELGPIEVSSLGAGGAFELELTHGGAIEGRVLLPDGRDAEGAIVAINHGDGRPQTQRAGPGGRFRFESLSEGSWQVVGRETEIDPGSTSYASVQDTAPIAWSCEVRAERTTRFDLDLTRP